jgi:transcription antitermination factor NusG
MSRNPLTSFEQSLEREGSSLAPRYYCLRTLSSRYDAVAAASLRSYGMPVLSPRLKEVIRDKNNRSYEKISSLFPSYVFSKFDLRYFRSLAYVHGVATIVGQGSMPEEVAGEVIEEIISRIDPDGFVRLSKRGCKKEENLKAGDQVQISEGPFAGFTGVFVEGLSGGQRVKILLDALHKSPYSSTLQPHVELARADVSALTIQ